jgi:hypothetical protein
MMVFAKYIKEIMWNKKTCDDDDDDVKCT